jgi:zinc-binding alcohol dehydrogenase/oxidoreductase
MKKNNALILKEARGLDGFELKTLDYTKPKSTEVVVQIKAAGLNHRDVWILKGQYANIVTPIILGSDGSGIVYEVGEEVSADWLGKAVLINPALEWGENPTVQHQNFRILGMPDNGTQAEFVTVPAVNIFEKPKYLTWEEAAAIPLAGLTGYRALFTQGRLKAGETVLLTGIGGGATVLMMQMALSLGAEVLVTSGSNQKIERAIQLGALTGVNYLEKNWQEKLRDIIGKKQIDLVVDSAGGPEFSELTSLVTPGGRIVFFGATAGNPTHLNLRQMYWKQITLQGTTMGRPEEFIEMVRLFESAHIKPVIDSSSLLKDYQQAYSRMINSTQFGKIVFKMSQ